MPKTLLTVGLVLLLAPMGLAQNYTTLSLRAGGGISTLSYPDAATVLSGQRNTQSVAPVFSYMAGLGLNIPLGGRVSVQPEITYVRKGYEFRITQNGVSGKGIYNFNYVEVPIFLKVAFAKDRFRLFVFAGPAVSYALNGTFDQTATNGTNRVTQAGKIRFSEGRSTASLQYYDPDSFRQVDVGIQGGIAVGARFGTGLLLIEARGGLGLTDFSRDEESKFRTGIVALSYSIPWVQCAVRNRSSVYGMNGNQRIIQNQYKLLSPVGSGEGGMGVVYRAVDLTLDREVAVKLIRPELHDNADITKRFQREAKALARLNHPNIASIYNFCQDGNEYCLVMEFVTGRNLADLLKAKGKFPQAEAVQLIAQALNGLAHAHDRGVLHRDLKPANLMLTDEGTVKLLDFGIARLTDATNTQITQTNNLTGTIRYMAPELLDNGQPSTSSDLYAMNLVLYELLTGRAAFKAPTMMRLITQILNEPPIPIREHLPRIPVALERLMEQMTAKQPDDRLSDARQFAKLLTEAAASPMTDPPVATVATDEVVILTETAIGPPPKARLSTPTPSPKPSQSPKPAINRPVWVWVGLLLSAVVLGTSLWYFVKNANRPNLAATGTGQLRIDTLHPKSNSKIPSGPEARSRAAVIVQPTDQIKQKATKVPPAPVNTKPQVTRPNSPPALNPSVKPKSVLAKQVSQKKQPVVASNTNSAGTALPPSASNGVTATSKPAERPAEETEPKPTTSPRNMSITRQTTLRLTPVAEYRADQLSRGDEVRFTVSALVDGETVPLSSATARAVVSEVKAIGGLSNRSYIFLKRVVLQTGADKTVKLSLVKAEPEILFDGREANAVVGPLLMRPTKPFTIDL